MLWIRFSDSDKLVYLFLRIFGSYKMSWNNTWRPLKKHKLTNQHGRRNTLVRVPVLSKITAETLWAPSRSAAPLIKTPNLAPIPVPTITAVGVANPRAQGHEIIITEMQKVSAKTKGFDPGRWEKGEKGWNHTFRNGNEAAWSNIIPEAEDNNCKKNYCRDKVGSNLIRKQLDRCLIITSRRKHRIKTTLLVCAFWTKTIIW